MSKTSQIGSNKCVSPLRVVEKGDIGSQSTTKRKTRTYVFIVKIEKNFCAFLLAFLLSTSETFLLIRLIQKQSKVALKSWTCFYYQGMLYVQWVNICARLAIETLIPTPWTQDVSWTYIWRLEDVQDVLWVSFMRSIYVLCLGTMAVLMSLLVTSSKCLVTGLKVL